MLEELLPIPQTSSYCSRLTSYSAEEGLDQLPSCLPFEIDAVSQGSEPLLLPLCLF